VLAEQADGLKRIRGMMGSLSEEAEKVLRTTRRLSATLRRLLDSRVASARQRLAGVLREVRGAALRRAEQPVPSDLGVTIFTELDVSNAWERSFWSAPVAFEPPVLREEPPDEDDRRAAFRHFAALQRLDWKAMRQQVAGLLRESAELELGDLLQAHPPAAGALEILAYLQIAHDDGHRIDPTVTETVRIPRGTPPASPEDAAFDEFEVPRVTFLRHPRGTRGKRVREPLP
jgi:hypothetical protein